ncbi:peptidylprolyl isomerase [Paenibacillus filicis]|uniref:Peptidyl-prolyl cis-trans isomerase n=1 Tax=Paenibacillus gyeongsangnamensis TaxID=3388067 RepID=A0ABT4Q6H9_9BACL|nr:peptidylprolyl isomerase [Paenibacillus filicis]MCZ8512480.1 peptidylprolyl isomerase [Paenibacillus filicis]
MSSGFLGLFLSVVAALHMVSATDHSPASVTENAKPQHEEISRQGELKERDRVRTYSHPPAMTIDTDQSYQAKVKTSKGDFTIELFTKSAPKTVNNFVFLAKDGFYERVIFHRVIKSFMVQTGDPTGTGSGGPGYTFEDELNSPYAYEPGTVAMANAGPGTNGSQFFICTGDDCKSLNRIPNYTIFGKVTDGMDTVLKIAETQVEKQKLTGELSHPMEEVKIESIEITVK